MNTPTIVWLRRDLRLDDNPTLDAALGAGGPILPVFIWSPEEEDEWRAGRASRWWLRRSLERLSRDLERRGATLILRRGPTIAAIDRLLEETGARRVLWSRRHEPAAIELGRRLGLHLAKEKVETATFESTLLSTDQTLTGAGTPFQKFTPFYRKFLQEATVALPGRSPGSIPSSGDRFSPESQRVMAEIGPDPSGANQNLDAFWEPGSAGAESRLNEFLEHHVSHYPDRHDRMDDTLGTSRLSPHLSFGEISARRVWHAATSSGSTAGTTAFIRQLVWREFAYEQLRAFPDIAVRPLRAEFEALPTSHDTQAFGLWQQGRTGYPVVDAGMRELAATGWMHNRARMVVASFLIKHLALPWQWGAHWFWENLVDADLANNSLNWQWVAGSAADASPYYRIFNPQRQGERFDPDGRYVRRWVPELRSFKGPGIHMPHERPGWDGAAYPTPIVHHTSARQAALARYAAVQKRKAGA